MKVHFQFLRGQAQLRGALLADGWQLSAVVGTHLDATHPEVGNEAAARGRLSRLGLLTSTLARIEFPCSLGA